jgi:predicted CoA-substrate-specific enzyme activase
MICGVDIGSTTCKYILASRPDEVLARGYARHHTRQAETLLELLTGLERDHGLTPGRDHVFFTGSGAGRTAGLLGARTFQEVVAVATAVERLHPSVRFVSEIGGEDMKTIFFTGEGRSRHKQVFMQSACSGGTGTFIEKTARKLELTAEQLAGMRYHGRALHKLSSKCGIFAEADANSLVKAGVPTEEIVASLFDAVVCQNLATLTRGLTPRPGVLLLGGPNLFFSGLREAWRHHLSELWRERNVVVADDQRAEDLVAVPQDALYYAALGCVDLGRAEAEATAAYAGTERLRWWIEEGQRDDKKKHGRRGLWNRPEDLTRFKRTFARVSAPLDAPCGKRVVVGCDFGSTTAKAVCLTPDGEIVRSCYALSKGNPIEDAKVLFRKIREITSDAEVMALAITGYGKDLLRDVLGADCAVAETIAHASAGLRFFPDADCICDVGGVDVKVMILRQGTVIDFRLNSQCSSGNGAFLQGAAERFGIPLAEVADRAFRAEAMPRLSMGCGVFLQSDIVSQQRRGWQAEEILAGLCGILPLNVWVYAGGLNNLSEIGRKFILQGGTHRNLAVVKAQVDFIRSKVKDAEIVVHPYSGEAGAIGAALVARDWWKAGGRTRFRSYDVLERLSYHAVTDGATVCRWCRVACQRTFVDVAVPGGRGRAWSAVPLAAGWERVIVNNSCPKGLVEDVNELRLIKAEMERTKRAFPNLAEVVRKEAFRDLGR